MDALNRDATEWTALAVSEMGAAQTEIAWGLSRGETGRTFYARIEQALHDARRAVAYLERVAETEPPSP